MYIGLPQAILLALYGFGLITVLIKDGEPDRYNFGSTLIATTIVLCLLYWGGFFSG